ncbi:hypothetical protein LUZ62_061972 [Rhynchospora pubera]|uniref:Uncharacterized protein n=1 Tax=Rhynchospora pubera TaxID=906938 RepID=A0AAV8EBV3_9POAL|nr:hypothetical protein LUZ62_061972 [Rhynchospora pubera]
MEERRECLIPYTCSHLSLHLYSPLPIPDLIASPRLNLRSDLSQSNSKDGQKKMEIEAPTPGRYLIGVAIMMAGVVLPLGYMMFRSKRSPASSSSSSSSSFAKQT